LSDLPRSTPVDAERRATFRVELHRRGGIEGPPLRFEIASVTGKHEILPPDPTFLRGEDPLALHRGRDESHLRHATLFDARQHQPGVTRLQRERGHRPTLSREFPRTIRL